MIKKKFSTRRKITLVFFYLLSLTLYSLAKRRSPLEWIPIEEEGIFRPFWILFAREVLEGLMFIGLISPLLLFVFFFDRFFPKRMSFFETPSFWHKFSKFLRKVFLFILFICSHSGIAFLFWIHRRPVEWRDSVRTMFPDWELVRPATEVPFLLNPVLSFEESTTETVGLHPWFLVKSPQQLPPSDGVFWMIRFFKEYPLGSLFLDVVNVIWGQYSGTRFYQDWGDFLFLLSHYSEPLKSVDLRDLQPDRFSRVIVNQSQIFWIRPDSHNRLKEVFQHWLMSARQVPPFVFVVNDGQETVVSEHWWLVSGWTSGFVPQNMLWIEGRLPDQMCETLSDTDVYLDVCVNSRGWLILVRQQEHIFLKNQLEQHHSMVFLPFDLSTEKEQSIVKLCVWYPGDLHVKCEIEKDRDKQQRLLQIGARFLVGERSL